MGAEAKACDEAKKIIEKAVRKAFPHAPVPKEIPLEKPRESSFGDRASSVAFVLARELKKNPAEIANAIAEASEAGKLVEKPGASGGYVNFFFTHDYCAEALNEILGEGKKFGENDSGKNKTVVIDFSSPNVGKPLHIGHIRSTVLGEALRAMMRANGWRVIGSNYLCEAGAQTAHLILGLEKFGAETIRDEKQLTEYYVRISKAVKESLELEKEAKDILYKMESGDKSIAAQLKAVRKISLPPIEKNYALLGVDFEENIFDGDLVDKAKKEVDEAVRKGIAFKDKEGEIVASLERYGVPNLVILRSNGTTLYSTRDLALADYRFEKHGFAKSIYVTASEQNLHFKQVFKILELMGRKYAHGLSHVGFGLIFLKEGKLSTREGRVLLLEDVLNEAIAAARHEITKWEKETVPEHKERIVKEKLGMSGNEVREASRIIGVGATKFAILRVSPEKNILFDPRAVVDFEGDTGAYVQYSLVRAKKILKKAAGKAGKKSGAEKKIGKTKFDSFEKEVAVLLSEFPLVVASQQPHALCDYLLRLCAEFNSFYANCPVLQAGDGGTRRKRIALVKATAAVLGNGLALLGIAAPEKM